MKGLITFFLVAFCSFNLFAMDDDGQEMEDQSMYKEEEGSMDGNAQIVQPEESSPSISAEEEDIELPIEEE